jgi:hypothetical protein
MARKTRKQKMRAQARIEQKVEHVAEKSTEKKSTATMPTMSAEDRAEAEVTKRGIIKTLIIIALLFVLQAAVFVAKSKGMLPF